MILMLCLLFSLFPAQAFAGDGGEITVTAEGTCGVGVNWVLSDDGVLRISGSGYMDDAIRGKAPWSSYDEAILSAVIEDGVLSVGANCFAELSALAEVTLGGDVSTIGEDAFSDCPALRKVSAPSLEKWLALELASFGSNPCCNGAALYLSGALLQAAPLMEPAVKPYIFAGCTSLQSLDIASNVKSFGEGAFSGCTALGTVNTQTLEAWLAVDFADRGANPLNNGAALKVNYSVLTTVVINLPVVKKWTFCGCTSVETVTVTDQVRTIGEGAFADMKNLRSVAAPELEKWLAIELLGRGANPCSSGAALTLNGEMLTELVLTEGTVKSYAFEGCSSLTSAVITGSAKVAGSFVFANCRHLAAATVNEADNALNEGTFSGAYSLSEVHLSDSVSTIGANAFADCSSLGEISIPSTVREIGASAFKGCTALKNVAISNLSAWCSISFADVYSNPCTLAHDLSINGIPVTVLMLPEAMTSLGSYVFSGCSNITELYVPYGMTRIGDSAFAGCTKLASVTLPTTLAYVRTGAFADCRAISAVYYAGSSDNRAAINFYTKNSPITGARWYYNHVHTPGDQCERIEKSCTSGESVRYLCTCGDGSKPHWYQEKLEAPLGHIWSEYETVEPTQTSAGSVSRHCLREGCDAHEDEIIPILPITVTLDPQGGSCSEETVSVIYDTPYELLPTPQKTGYAFVGWFEAKLGGEAITNETVVSIGRDHTLYARWELNALVLSTVEDPALRAVLSLYDEDDSAVLERAEIAAISLLDVSGRGVKSLSGVEKLFKLEKINCANNEIETLDLSSMLTLKELDCSNNRLTELRLGEKPQLSVLDCSGNALLTLDLSACADGLTVNAADNLRTVTVDGNEKLIDMAALDPAFADANASAWTNSVFRGDGIVKVNALSRKVTYSYELGGEHGKATFTLQAVSASPAKLSASGGFHKPGESFSVAVRLDNNPALAHLSFSVSYDEAVLSLAGIEDGLLTGWHYDVATKTLSWSGREDFDTFGDIVLLNFVGTEEGGRTKVEILNISARDIESNAHSFTTESETVIVSDTITGDVNGDGVVTSLDLLRLKKHLAKLPVEIDPIAADVNKDGNVTSVDLLRLKKYLAHIIPEL